MPIPVEMRNGTKTFTVLENNPVVMNPLATKLGLTKDLTFYDVYSLTDPDLISHIPRPVYALLVIIPMNPIWYGSREWEDAGMEEYTGSGPEEPVIWFKQTIGHACGSIGLLHSVINGPAKAHIRPGSTLAKIREAAIPLTQIDRAQMLYDSKDFEIAHQSVAELGDTKAPSASEGDRLGQHFISFVKEGGRLWELEGSRKGPIDRGALEEDEDVLSPKAIEMGIGAVIKLLKDHGGGDLRFSVIALAKAECDGVNDG